ncbi:hypothetical protein BKA70DRAFT_1423295 [Coprinopsis sp. MPI-PUGE-AT-0042]|nr:hypothetical protein BKA70DRAFT_1423295 [Coprinopsis sp. MPI-PUGE-AT-0042]
MVETNLRNTYGALLVGIYIAICLFGIITMQALHYLTNSRDDHRALQFTVVVLCFLELGHTIGITSELYRFLIPSEENRKFIGLGAALLLGGLSTLIVQGFFSRRIWRLLPRPYNYVGLLCAALAFVRAIGTIYLAYLALKTHDLALFQDESGWIISGLLGLSMGVDVIIAISMLAFLSSRRNGDFGRFGQIIDRLVAYSVRTGLFTSLTAILALVCFTTMPRNFIWMGVYCLLSKLYTNSLLASLVERRQLRDAVQSSPPPGLGRVPVMVFKRQSRGKISRKKGSLVPSSPILIEMQTTLNTDKAHPETILEKEHGADDDSPLSYSQTPSTLRYPLSDKMSGKVA